MIVHSPDVPFGDTVALTEKVGRFVCFIQFVRSFLRSTAGRQRRTSALQTQVRVFHILNVRYTDVVGNDVNDIALWTRDPSVLAVCCDETYDGVTRCCPQVLCDAEPSCVGFNSAGLLKNSSTVQHTFASLHSLVVLQTTPAPGVDFYRRTRR